MMSMTDVPNGNISFLKGVRQVVLTPLLCQLTQLSSFVLPAQRRTEGCRAVLVKLRVPPARTTTLIFCIAFLGTQVFGEWRRNLHVQHTIWVCFGEWRRNLHKFLSVMTCFGEWRRNLHKIFKHFDVSRRVETDSPPESEGLLLLSVL